MTSVKHHHVHDGEEQLAPTPVVENWLATETETRRTFRHKVLMMMTMMVVMVMMMATMMMVCMVMVVVVMTMTTKQVTSEWID